MSDWELKEETITARQWVRSWRQEFFTDLGGAFRMVAHMERVTLLPNGSVSHEQLPSVSRDILGVGGDVRVQQLNSLLTELINEWRIEDDAKAGYNDASGGLG